MPFYSGVSINSTISNEARFNLVLVENHNISGSTENILIEEPIDEPIEEPIEEPIDEQIEEPIEDQIDDEGIYDELINIEPITNSEINLVLNNNELIPEVCIWCHSSSVIIRDCGFRDVVIASDEEHPPMHSHCGYGCFHCNFPV
jgi:hypothetical protein